MFIINNAYSKFGNSSYKEQNSRSGFGFYNLLQTVFSLKNLRKSDVCFFISNRNDINEYITTNNDLKELFKNAIVISTQGASNIKREDYLYIDPVKAITRAFFAFFYQNKSFSALAKRKYFEGVLLYYYTKFLLFFIKPKKAYFINWYEYYPSLLALDVNTESIEIQHGIIYDYHYGYNVNASSLTRKPDKFLVWHENFIKSISIGEKVNFSLLQPKILKQLKINQNTNNVCVIISQSTIREFINIKLLDLKTYLNSFETVIYRIHPKDEVIIDKIINELSWIKNIKISSPSEQKAEDLLNNNWTYVGVYSTLILDLILNNQKVKILDIEGANIMNDLIILDNVEKI